MFEPHAVEHSGLPPPPSESLLLRISRSPIGELKGSSTTVLNPISTTHEHINTSRAFSYLIYENSLLHSDITPSIYTFTYTPQTQAAEKLLATLL